MSWVNLKDQLTIKSQSKHNFETVTKITHWTEKLFSFNVTRPLNLRFRSGEFIMIGLLNENREPILRAYSIASGTWEDELEFYSIKVPNGPLTSRLQHIKIGDQIILSSKPVGTLVHDALSPGKNLWFFSTGTGIAPFASLVKEPQTYEDYEKVILTHTCRNTADLEYGKTIVESLRTNPILTDIIGAKLIYYPTTTRENSKITGRITDLIRTGKIFNDLKIEKLTKTADRVMVCGSIALNKELKEILEGFGLRQGANSDPAEFVVEKAFVD